MTPYLAVALTSLVAYFIAVKRLGWQPSDLGRALGRMAESLGAGMIFAVVNVLAAAGLVLGLRTLTDRSSTVRPATTSVSSSASASASITPMTIELLACEKARGGHST